MNPMNLMNAFNQAATPSTPSNQPEHDERIYHGNSGFDLEPVSDSETESEQEEIMETPKNKRTRVTQEELEEKEIQKRKRIRLDTDGEKFQGRIKTETKYVDRWTEPVKVTKISVIEEVMDVSKLPKEILLKIQEYLKPKEEGLVQSYVNYSDYLKLYKRVEKLEEQLLDHGIPIEVSRPM